LPSASINSDEFAADRNGAAQDPHLEFARRVAQERLHDASAVGFGNFQLVGVFKTDEREILGQAGDQRAEVLCYAQQFAGRLEIVGNHVA
jgi:hypothetical protein